MVVPLPDPATPAALLEAFTQVLLGRDLEVWRDQEREHKEGWEWLQRSVTLARQGHGSAAARTLYASLCRSAGRRRPCRRSCHAVGTTHARAAMAGIKEPGDTVPQTSLPTGTEQRGKAKEQVRRVELNQQDIDNDVLVHTFEKIETAEEFCGVTRTPMGRMNSPSMPRRSTHWTCATSCGATPDTVHLPG